MFAAIWNSYLGELVELHQPLPTRFNIETLTVTRLDRVYTSLPASLLIKLGVSVAIAHSPEGLHYERISDHAPLDITFAPKHLGGTLPSCLPKAWCSGHVFERSLAQYVQYINLDSMHPLERISVYKKCIRAAALHTRDVTSFTDKKGVETSRLVLESVSRALWQNNCSLARKLLVLLSLQEFSLKLRETGSGPFVLRILRLRMLMRRFPIFGGNTGISRAN